ncbi:MAG: aldehyde dehydrogenase family protein [Pseudomonadota bacterium]
MSEQQDIELVDAVVARARAAQQRYAANADQAQLRLNAQAAAWALMDPTRNQTLSERAVETTGLGNVADKVRKNHRKTLGLLRDVLAAQTTGVLSDNASSGITEVARPVGVVGAVVPSTNPVATPTNNVVNALVCGNAIVLSPSPRGAAVCEQLIGHMHAEFAKIGADPDLVQMVPAPSSKVKTQHLMESVDLLIVTGSQDNVRRAYSSGTPAIGVGAGNVSVIVDGSADLDDAARKIAASKSFDNATSCSSENALIVLDAVYDDMLDALHRAGGRLLQGDNAAKLHSALFQGGGLNKHLIARDIDVLIAGADVSVTDADSARFLLIEGHGVGPDKPESGEKLSLVMTLYRAPDFAAAKQLATALFEHIGAGHSIGLHSEDDARALELARDMPTCRVIVNQAHCFATGGSFDNGMPFSLSMGCGTWGGNSIDDNLNYTHFMNVSKVVRVIPENEPSLDDVFANYWAAAGR